jgi:hypothetical protein
MSLKVWVLQHFGAIQDGHVNFENNIKLLTGIIKKENLKRNSKTY